MCIDGCCSEKTQGSSQGYWLPSFFWYTSGLSVAVNSVKSIAQKRIKGMNKKMLLRLWISKRYVCVIWNYILSKFCRIYTFSSLIQVKSMSMFQLTGFLKIRQIVLISMSLDCISSVLLCLIGQINYHNI